MYVQQLCPGRPARVLYLEDDDLIHRGRRRGQPHNTKHTYMNQITSTHNKHNITTISNYNNNNSNNNNNNSNNNINNNNYSYYDDCYYYPRL